MPTRTSARGRHQRQPLTTSNVVELRAQLAARTNSRTSPFPVRTPKRNQWSSDSASTPRGGMYGDRPVTRYTMRRSPATIASTVDSVPAVTASPNPATRPTCRPNHRLGESANSLQRMGATTPNVAIDRMRSRRRGSCRVDLTNPAARRPQWTAPTASRQRVSTSRAYPARKSAVSVVSRRCPPSATR
jgi:hypothetical protein